MQIKRANYLLTAVKAAQYPEQQLPAVTFCGRSNVGKSSLINTLLNRRNLARTSSQPGKTRTINFYDIDGAWYLVDLPGYGYAKVAKAERENWRVMIDEYLKNTAGRSCLCSLWIFAMNRALWTARCGNGWWRRARPLSLWPPSRIRSAGERGPNIWR